MLLPLPVLLVSGAADAHTDLCAYKNLGIYMYAYVDMYVSVCHTSLFSLSLDVCEYMSVVSIDL